MKVVILAMDALQQCLSIVIFDSLNICVEGECDFSSDVYYFSVASYSFIFYFLANAAWRMFSLKFFCSNLPQFLCSLLGYQEDS